MTWGLPKSVEVCGAEYEIRTDFRVILDIFAATSEPELDGQEKALAVLTMFYPGFDDMPPEHYEEALQACFRFINCESKEAPHKSPKLVDWEQDYPLIIAPINRVLGYEARAIDYDAEANTGGLHWWTWLSAYYEIGDCTFAQVVRVRDQLARGKRLEKQDREWYRKNQQLVDLKQRYSSSDQNFFKEWGGA